MLMCVYKEIQIEKEKFPIPNLKFLMGGDLDTSDFFQKRFTKKFKDEFM